VGDREQQIFLGREFAQHRKISDKTAEVVDTEIKRILDEAYRRARAILEGDMETLHRMAEALLERETLDRDEVDLLARGDTLPPPPAPKPEPTGESVGKTERATDAPSGRPVLGAPPAEPAGA
jgi:cell division protease FtsH